MPIFLLTGYSERHSNPNNLWHYLIAANVSKHSYLHCFLLASVSIISIIAQLVLVNIHFILCSIHYPFVFLSLPPFRFPPLTHEGRFVSPCTVLLHGWGRGRARLQLPPPLPRSGFLAASGVLSCTAALYDTETRRRDCDKMVIIELTSIPYTAKALNNKICMFDNNV